MVSLQNIVTFGQRSLRITDSLPFAMTMTNSVATDPVNLLAGTPHLGKKGDCFAPLIKVFNAPITLA